MKYQCNTPVLLLFFNRPLHARAVLERVRAVRPTRLYLHLDGARAQVAGEAEAVAAVRQLKNGIDWDCELKTLERSENMGLRKGVYGALNWFFEQEEAGIILEDDCLPDPSFFPFCEELLLRYRNDHRVMHIGGYNNADKWTRENVQSYFFSRLVMVWGWASWRRAWKKMQISLDDFDKFAAENGIFRLTDSRPTQAYMMEKFELTHQHRNNSWAYAWFFSVLNADGYAVVPSVNLIENTGVGVAQATHTQKKEANFAVQASSMHFPLLHPTGVQRDNRTDQKLLYLTQKSKGRLFLWHLLKKIGLR